MVQSKTTKKKQYCCLKVCFEVKGIKKYTNLAISSILIDWPSYPDFKKVKIIALRCLHQKLWELL